MTPLEAAKRLEEKTIKHFGYEAWNTLRPYFDDLHAAAGNTARQPKRVTLPGEPEPWDGEEHITPQAYAYRRKQLKAGLDAWFQNTTTN